LDRPALKPLPGRRYEFAEWKKAGVNIDYHIEVDHNYYSVPYTLVRKEVEVRLTLGTVEALLIAEAQVIGPETGKLVQAILLDRPHPEQGYRACLGVVRLGRRYPQERIEAAAQRANRSGVRSYKRLESILDHGLDRVSLEPRPETPPAAHSNVRGPHYFGKEATSC